MNASTAGRRIVPPRALVLLLALTLAAGGALAPPRAAAYHFPRCSRVLSRYPNHSPKEVVEVVARRGLSCAHAERVGASLLRAVLARRIPLSAFAPHAGAPGYPHPGHPFSLATPLGRFRCHMTAAGSDFVAATCRRGRKYLRVLRRYALVGAPRSGPDTPLARDPFRRGVKPGQKWGKRIRRLSESPATIGRTSFANPS